MEKLEIEEVIKKYIQEHLAVTIRVNENKTIEVKCWIDDDVFFTSNSEIW